jgi:hypothetical protein
MFVCTRSRGKADYPDRRQSNCPFIKLHLVPPMLFVQCFLFCACALAEQKRFAPAPRGAIDAENRGIRDI